MSNELVASPRLDINDLVTAISDARAAYQAVANTASAPEKYELSQKVKALQTELRERLAEGANPCPRCDSPAVGVIHETEHGRRYEVGCPVCSGAFVHKDGTKRLTRVKDALMPKHAVEAWNAGPDFWMVPKK